MSKLNIPLIEKLDLTKSILERAIQIRKRLSYAGDRRGEEIANSVVKRQMYGIRSERGDKRVNTKYI
jgi:hypothetical protein